MHRFEAELAASWPLDRWTDVGVVLAVSGGADSVALLRAATALRRSNPGDGFLTVAHFNHRLRGDESDGDERFVVDLCRAHHLPFDVDRAGDGEIAAGAADGLEESARRRRYRFLSHVAARRGARYIATAHTADDQAETILHRILRGTGIRGLAGIPRARRLGHASLVRPMLFGRRRDVLAYLTDLEQPYRDDSSNLDCSLTRNRLRHDLLPHLARHYNARVADALLRLGQQAAETQAVVDRQVEAVYDRCVKAGGHGAVRVALPPLVDQPACVIREVLATIWRSRQWPLQAMGFEQWNQLCAAITHGAAQRLTLPGRITVDLSRDELLLDREEEPLSR